MADNLATSGGSAGPAATDEVTYSGDTAHVQLVRQVHVSGTEGSKTVAAISDSSGVFSQGSVAHDAVDAGNPSKLGAKAIAHGTNPTAVAAGDRTDLYANRAGVPFTIGGHPNVKCATYITTAAGTDDNVLPAIATGLKYVVTRVSVMLDEATTVGVACRLGFGTANVPALGASQADAVDGILVSHPGLVPGSGFQVGDGSGILGVGGDGEELRVTNEVPTSGSLHISVSYYTIES